jgi:hypothetical protein
VSLYIFFAVAALYISSVFSMPLRVVFAKINSCPRHINISGKIKTSLALAEQQQDVY